jgi:GNAT superfamily N-acetyltransferase
MEGVVVRRIVPGEWRELRRIRLEALADEPLAFGSTHEREAAYTDSHWQRHAGALAEAKWTVGVVGVHGTTFVALAQGYVDEDDPEIAHLISVFVAPEWRGRGLGREVSAAVVDWARERDRRRVLLNVADWNDPAREVYASLGFSATGRTKHLSHDRSITEHELALDL